jgi:HAD superfamily hydrolase (TIGR01509 family)
MLPVPEAVILDLDGTLVDTVDTRIRAWLAVFDEFGIPATRDQVAPLIGIDGRRLAREVAADAGAELPHGGDEAIDLRAGEVYGLLNREPRALPGAHALLMGLDSIGLRWAIATSSRREQVAASVAALHLPREPRIVDGSSVAHAKPEPDLLLLAARELGVQDAGCWYVGDSVWDMRAARAAGQVPVGILAGAAVDGEALQAAGAAAVLGSLDELLPLLPVSA